MGIKALYPSYGHLSPGGGKEKSHLSPSGRETERGLYLKRELNIK